MFEERFDVRPIFGGGIRYLEFPGSLFTNPPARLAASGIYRPQTCDATTPRGGRHARRQTPRLSGEFDEDGLRHLFGVLR